MKKILPLVLLACVAAAPASALDLIGQDPVFDTFVIKVEEPVTLIFDASLNGATVTTDNVFLTRVDNASVVAASLSLASTNQADDTVVIDPTADLRFGVRYRLTIETALEDAGANAFSGAYPFGRDFVPNVPRDLHFPNCAPDDTACLTDLTNHLMGFNPIDPEGTDPSKIYTIPGMSVTEAWKWATGRPDVLVAVIDDGMTDYEEADLRDRLFLNTGELPEPEIGTTPCGDYDCNGDGRFSASDYAADDRVLAYAGANPVNVGHLLSAFSDGVDDDGNGLPDDISGWDFFRDVNETLGVAEFPEGTHGDGADNIVGAAENGSGDLIGVCPNCSVLEIRVSDAVIADINLIGAAVDYAHDMGAKVISIAMGSFNYSDAAHRSILDAYADGVLTIAAGGDEMGIHHLWPAAGEDVINVTALFPFPPVHLFDFVPIELIAFTESYCTNFGAHTDVSVPAGHICTSEATNNTSGVAALIVSRARDVGIEPSANELKQLMTISADDIYERCVSLVEGPSMGGVCRKGWDQHFGYGRLNAKRAFDMLGYPEEGIDPAVPPEARITDPIWWRTYDPSVTPTVDVFGQMSSRAGSYRWELQGALGVQPFNGDFRVLASGDESSPVDGFIATADISGLMDESDWSRPPDNAVDKVATLRLRVWSDEPGGEAMGEARKALRLHRDDDPETGLIPGFPLALGMSVESSPRLYDMDGDPDGRLEIVFATSLGTVEVLKYDDGKGTWENAPGFPVDVSGEDPRYAEGVISAVAVGDVFGDGLPKIVAATLGCTVYLIHHDGENHDGGAIVDGFPVRVDEPGNDSSFEFGHGNAILASPVLADLDRDGLLDIVVGASDQFVYAWSPLDENDDGEADRMSGWPILLSSAPGLVPGWKKCTDALPAQILGTPAVGILDPDHENPDIALHPAVIVPVTETCNDGVVPTSRVYAVYWNGTDNSLGPYLPGWPAVITTPLGDAIPVPPLTAGATNSPAVWIDDNGTARVSAGSFFWLPQMIAWDGMETVVASYGGHANFTSTTNGTFAKFRGDDSMQFLLPTLGALNLIDGVVKLESWNILGWDVDNYRDSVFRERWEDFMAFLNPIVADISGDNLPEVIAGSGGYNVHAFDIRGREPETWPKATHNWAIASAAVGDIDRDGKLEVVQAMHEGDIFAWNTKGRECKKGEANSDWRGFHHDERGTGFYGADTLPPAMVTELFHMDEGGGRFTLTFAAPGDELGCGTVTGYDVRYATSAGADLRPLDAFNAAAEATVLSAAEDFLTGGNKQRLTVEAPEDARVFALRAYDDFGHLAWPSVASTEGEPESDDDDIDDDDFADDDDTTADDDGDDDDDDDGCGC